MVRNPSNVFLWSCRWPWQIFQRLPNTCRTDKAQFCKVILIIILMAYSWQASAFPASTAGLCVFSLGSACRSNLLCSCLASRSAPHCISSWSAAHGKWCSISTFVTDELKEYCSKLLEIVCPFTRRKRYFRGLSSNTFHCCMSRDMLKSTVRPFLHAVDFVIVRFCLILLLF